MQHVPTSDVTIDGVRYQLRKMTPARAGYIWQRVIMAMFKAQDEVGGSASDADLKVVERRSPEERVKGMCALAFMYMDLADFEFTQSEAMQAVSRWESIGGEAPVPMPVMKDARQWAIADIAADPQLVTRLTLEVVAFNCAGFLPGSSGT